MNASQRELLQYRLTLLLEGRLDEEERQQLEDLIRSDAAILAFCQEYFFVWAGLHQPCSVQSELWSDEVVQSGRRGRQRPVRHWSLAAAAVLLLMLGMWWARSHFSHPVSQPVLVATLEDGRDIKWAKAGRGDPNGMMAAGDWMLLQGIAQIRVGHVARVLIQGPCAFSLDDDQQMTLSWGKMTAHILPKSTGFTLISGATRIVDRGTEFGVLAQLSGGNEIHVFDGKVEVSARDQGGLTSELTANHAAIVDAQGHFRVSGQAQPQRFVRTLPASGVAACAGRRLDLADMVGGGNGLGTGEIDRGLDPCGGQVVRPNSTRVKDVRCTYTPLPFVNYIDGVFVASWTGQGPVIDSAGDVFKECPMTDSDYYEGIFDGVKLSVAGSLEFQQGVLAGQAYGTRDHPAMNLHANAGITFDLDAIRLDYPGVNIDRLTAIAGISDTVLPHLQDDDMTDIWVLLDGKVVYYHRFTARGDHHDDLNVKIRKANHYLTLVSTSDGDSSFSWSFLAEPMLELVRDE